MENVKSSASGRGASRMKRAPRNGETSLRRLLGRRDLTAIGINQAIGGAVFLIPAEIAFRLGGWSPWLCF